MKTGKELWFFTMRYPFGTGEAFIENELPILAEHYDKVIIIPLFKADGRREIPWNAIVRPYLDDPFQGASPCQLFWHRSVYQKVEQCVRSSAPNEAVLAAQWNVVGSQLRQSLRRALDLRSKVFFNYDPAKVDLYSYWSADWTTVLGVLKEMDPRVRFVCRMHGFDLFADRAPQNWPAFQKFHVQQAERIFIASEAGRADLVARYPDQQEKFETAHLGTSDHGMAPWSSSAQLRIASCANLVPLKRVHLLAEALASVDMPVQWTHFGDGPERARIEAVIATLPAHVRVLLKGAVPNAELLNWYKENAVDLFVHTSETEGGVPVSMQEAASFGIPLLALDAGGVRELVDERTGALLPQDADTAMIAQGIDRFITSAQRTEAFRSGVRAQWEQRFFARATYERFYQHMISALGGA